jgi:DNA-binding transcriptional regulator YdaS (Cro superfamily)
MNTVQKSLDKARAILGSYAAVGAVCGGLSGKAVEKWRKRGRLPRTEYTGETHYAELIERATEGAIQQADLRPEVSLATDQAA